MDDPEATAATKGGAAETKEAMPAEEGGGTAKLAAGAKQAAAKASEKESGWRRMAILS